MLICGTKGPPGPAADRHQGEHRVDEGRDECPERQLRAAVPDEGAQHPGAELGGDQGQRHDDDREDDADDGDDRRRDRGQDLPRGIGRAADDPRRKHERAVVGGPVGHVADSEQAQRGQDLDRRDQPQVGAQRFLVVAGQVETADHCGALRCPDYRPVFPAHTRAKLTRRRAQPTQAGPSSCFRSASSAGDGLTRSLSSSRTIVARGPLQSFRCTSDRPGWVHSTSCSRSTTGATHRWTGIDTTKGPPSSAVRSGTLTSCAISFGISSRRSSRPLTIRIASSASSSEHCW